MVPAIAIGFYLTDGIGLRDKFAEVLYANLDADQPIIDSLLQAADNIVVTAESGLFGLISMGTFIWLVLFLMMTVRRVFNNVWKVDKENLMSAASALRRPWTSWTNTWTKPSS